MKSSHHIGSPKLPLFFLSGYIKQQEMQKEPKSYGAVYEVDAETWKALKISSVRARMEARKEAQSESWEAICRIAGREIDFEVDDLVALDARARAEFKRAKAEARERAVAAVETKQEREDKEERAAEYREDARKWSGIADDLLWRHAGFDDSD